jgi:Glycosyltransferase family 87
VSLVQDSVVPAQGSGGKTPRERATWTAAVTLFVVVPFAVLFAHFSDVLTNGTVGYDFRIYYDAAQALLDGRTPYVSADIAYEYGGYIYPPLTAVAVIPLTLLKPEVAGPLAMVLLVLAALAIPYVLGVRDWICYGLVLLWPPVVHGIQTSNVTILVALLAALVWRWRDRAPEAGLALGAGLASKFLLWPVALWLAATRRYRATWWAAVFSLVLVLGPWAAIGFVGLREYPGLVRRFSEITDDHAYSLYAAALHLGAPSPVARLLWLGVGLAVLAAVVAYGRLGDERTAFVFAIGATLSVTPVVEIPYFALLLVVVAVTQPRVGPLWFVPLAMWGTAGSYEPTTFETVGTVAVAAATVGLALWVLRGERAAERARTPVLGAEAPA